MTHYIWCAGRKYELTSNGYFCTPRNALYLRELRRKWAIRFAWLLIAIGCGIGFWTMVVKGIEGL